MISGYPGMEYAARARALLASCNKPPAELLGLIEELVAVHEKLARRFEKLVRISDGYQFLVRRTAEQFQSMIERTSDGVLITQDGIVKYSNARMLGIVGYGPEELRGRAFADLLHPKDRGEVFEACTRKTIEIGEPPVHESVMMHRDGTLVDVELCVGGMIYREAPAEFVFIRNITERKRYEAELRDLNRRLEAAARADWLTGCANRRGMIERIECEINRARRSGNPFSLVMFDIDLFKRVNDTWGHEAGDRVLVRIVEAVLERVRGQDVLARWGGEEFLVMLPETNSKGAMIVAEDIRRVVESLRTEVGSGCVSVTISLGVVEYSLGTSIDDAIRQADQCLYEAKRQGRNRSVLSCSAPDPGAR